LIDLIIDLVAVVLSINRRKNKMLLQSPEKQVLTRSTAWLKAIVLLRVYKGRISQFMEALVTDHQSALSLSSGAIMETRTAMQISQ
jgi:hypothetical protein